MTRLRVGISTCPNDTFAFHGLLSGEVNVAGVELDIELTDIEELNTGMLAGRFDVCKVSTHAALASADRIRCLPVGWALGFGIGPVVLAPRRERGPGEVPRVLCPGEWTTATLLWRLFHPETVHLEQRVFSEIVPALLRGEADLGVCIHEGRFTFADHGLALVEDLGETWERATSTPLPLGGLVARRSLDPTDLEGVVAAVRRSIAHGRAAPEQALASMRRHAQESSDAVLWKHVELYVNERTVDLAQEGRRAIRALSHLARERGLLPPGTELEVHRDGGAGPE